MTVRGPWYISARAVREYAALAGLPDPDVDDDAWDEAEDALIEMAARTVAAERRPRRTASGLWTYRGPRPLRLRLVVSDSERPEGPLPQLVSVLPASDRGRGNGMDSDTARPSSGREEA